MSLKQPTINVNFDHPEVIKSIGKIVGQRKVIDYYICRDPSAMDVREEVMDLIGDGWELLGGISVTFDEEKSFYAQAMVKYG
jgi:hypothetical protein